MTRSLAAAALCAALLPATLLAQDPNYAEHPSFTGLSNSGSGRSAPRPGTDFPMLEFDSEWGLVSSKARLILHEDGQSRAIGVLDQGPGMALHGAYRFRDDGEGTPERARINFLDYSADIGEKIALELPRFSTFRRGAEIGRIRQRAAFSVGTGIDVYTKGSFDERIGYIDQKLGATFLDDVVRGFGSFGLHTSDKVYTFYRLEHREVENTGISRLLWDTRYETIQVPLFHFTTGTATGTGPGGLFVDPEGNPILGIKGDWWVSQNIFDLLVRRSDNEGTAGKVLRGLGTVLEAMDDDPSNDGNSLEDGDELVRNSSAYLGSFLVGIIYFQEFRDLTGIQLPIAAVE